MSTDPPAPPGPAAPRHPRGLPASHPPTARQLPDQPPPRVLDLRLAPPAAASWAAAWLALGCPPQWARLVIAAALAGGGAGLLALAWACTRHVARHRHDPRPGAGRGSWRAPASAVWGLALMCAAATAVVAGADLTVRASDPLLVAARQPTTVRIEAVLTAPARLARSGRHLVVVLDARRLVTAQARSPSRARVIALVPSTWSGLERGTLVRTTMRVRALPAGQRAAVLGRSTRAPEVLSGPSGVAATVAAAGGGLRASLGLAPTGHGDSVTAREARLWPDASSALVVGVTLGDDSALPLRSREMLRLAGLTHLSAVSGQHVALVVGTTVSLLGWMPRRARAVVAAVVLAGLVVLVGPSGSVLRAATMGCVGLLGVGAGRRSHAVAALCAGVVVLMVTDPWQARDLGTALSVCATAAIVLAGEPVAVWLERRVGGVLCPRACAGAVPGAGGAAGAGEGVRWRRALARAVSVPVVAQAACTPLLVPLQGFFTPWAVVSNVVVAPVVAPVTVCGLAATALGLWWPQAAACAAWVARAGCGWILLVAQVVSTLPAARVDGAGPGVVAVVLVLVLAAGGLGWRAWRRRTIARGH